jgi:hypothetical protein
MDETKEKQSLKAIEDFFLSSHDFNGLPFSDILSIFENDLARCRMTLKKLVNEKKISIVFGDIHPNPHIKAFDDEPIEQQNKKIELDKLFHACIYPAEGHLSHKIKIGDYGDEIYKFRMATGEPQLRMVAFDTSVLEHYRNDPRYVYHTDQFVGMISIRNEYYDKGVMKKSDEALIQSFGYCFNDELDRGVGVCLRYLADLSAEHQKVWKAKELTGSYEWHPVYYQTQICGRWPEGIGIFSAILKEMALINEMCRAIKGVALFNNTFGQPAEVPEFEFLLRPTSKELNNFMMLLDKLLSENINKDFFRDDVELQEEVGKEDGKVEVRQKGTIRLLEEYLKDHFKTPDETFMPAVVGTLKEIRKRRQPQAHSIRDNIFDKAILKQQRLILQDAYNAVSGLRQAFSCHPAAKTIVVDEDLLAGRIWNR